MKRDKQEPKAVGRPRLEDSKPEILESALRLNGEGFTVAEIAQALEVASGTIENMLNRQGIVTGRELREDRIKQAKRALHMRARGLSYRAIGDELGRSPSAVSRLISQARAHGVTF